MTPSERAWLQEARRNIWMALTKAEYGDWNSVVAIASSIHRHPDASGEGFEVQSLLASLATSNVTDLRSSAAMRAAAVRRLNDAKTFIGSTLVGEPRP